MKKDIKGRILSFILGAVIFSSFTAYATIVIFANNVDYSPRDTEWNVDNVEDAIDDLYDQLRTCPVGSASGFVGMAFDFSYTGFEQSFTVPANGFYLLEAWGAQGGNNTYYNNSPGGYGGYSQGLYYGVKGDIIYVIVGRKGVDSPGTTSGQNASYSYNGGARGWASGGGATHMATVTGELNALSDYKSTASENVSNEILIVAGGGGGSAISRGGDGGGYLGKEGYPVSGYTVAGHGGTQTSGGLSANNNCANGLNKGPTCGVFGQGGEGANTASSGGGGGWYGGGGGKDPGPWTAIGPGAGGSGYIASPNLESQGEYTKHMACYNCTGTYLSDEDNTKTINALGVTEVPTRDNAKTGNGYARITYMG